MIKISQTEDQELLKDILQQLHDNDNYCPCSLIKTAETKCMCAVFRNMINNQQLGECPCGRYIITTTDKVNN